MSLSCVTVNRETQMNKNMKDNKENDGQNKSSEHIESVSYKYGECWTYVDRPHQPSKNGEYDPSEDEEERSSEGQIDSSASENSEPCDHGDQKSSASVEHDSSNDMKSSGDERSGSSTGLSNLMSTKVVPQKMKKHRKVLKRIHKVFSRIKTVFGCHCQPSTKDCHCLGPSIHPSIHPSSNLL